MSSQILSQAKLMSYLAPAIEENPTVDRQEQPLSDVDPKIVQNAPRLRERDGVKVARSTQTFHTAISEPLEISNQKEATTVPGEAESHIVKQDPISTESQTRRFVSASDDRECNTDTPRPTPEEQTSSGQYNKNVAIDIPTLTSVENRATSPRDGQNQHKEPLRQSRATLSPLESPNKAQAKPKDSSQVPAGIVSSRLRGIAASDPGCEPPSAFRRLWKSCHQASPPRDRNLNTTLDGSMVVESHTKDPLTKVSQEEDIASLASLAEVIQSQDDILYLTSLSKEEPIEHPDTPFKTTQPRARITPSIAPVSGPHIADSVLKITDREPLGEQLKVPRSTALFGNTDKPPTTPRRSATESSILGRSSGSSVKALAAKFNNTETNARQSPSPINTADTRRFRSSSIERAVVSPYTVNTSPIPMSLTLKGSSRSLQVTHNEMVVQSHTAASPDKVREGTSPRLLNPLFTKMNPQNNSGPPQWPKLRPVNSSPRPDSTLVRIDNGHTGSFPDSSNLHRTGDGNLSFTISRKSSFGTVLPRPDEPPVAGFAGISRASGACSDGYSSPFGISDPNHDTFSGVLSSPLVSQKESGRSTSMLYSQIQYLYRQLKAKEDEVEHLRQQLMTRDRLNDLSSLGQQLRQAKRDSTLWRGRAEIAEKRLEMLTHISHQGRLGAVTEEQLVTELMGNGSLIGVEEED